MRPRISTLRLWQRHEERVLAVLTRALQMIVTVPDMPTNEDEINRLLCRCLNRANFELSQQGEGLASPVVYEARNQPSADDGQRAAREDKRPDFQWGFVNMEESDPDRASVFYTIECKRLGQSGRKDWILNENYAEHGVKRFATREHGYGMGVSSGAMVGYVQNMEYVQVLEEVSRALEARGLSPILLSRSGWRKDGATRLEEALDRPSVPPSPFCLRHVWVDMRHCYS